MITYKITTAFQADWDNVFAVVFPGRQHSFSQISGNVGLFGFEDATVTPTDLGPLVRVEVIPSP